MKVDKFTMDFEDFLEEQEEKDFLMGSIESEESAIIIRKVNREAAMKKRATIISFVFMFFTMVAAMVGSMVFVKVVFDPSFYHFLAICITIGMIIFCVCGLCFEYVRERIKF